MQAVRSSENKVINMAKKEKTIQVTGITIDHAKVLVVGDSDLILNKMNARNRRALIRKQKGLPPIIEEPNEWEDLITSMWWRDGEPTDFTKEGFYNALKENAPCIPTFAFLNSFKNAVIRCGFDAKGTEFMANVSVTNSNRLIPIKFATHRIEEKLIAAKLGSPVYSQQNVFSGWEAEVEVAYLNGGMFTLDQILQVANVAGFGCGVGSGRTSGYGRYHVEDVLPL